MSERRLSEIAKVLRQPEGIVGSEFTRINKAARKAGIRFDLWQKGFLWLLFAKNTEGKYACGADGAVLSSCRQIGKTFTVGTALFLKAILTPNLKAIWTAHHTRTSDETFADMCEMEHNPMLGRYVERIRRANRRSRSRPAAASCSAPERTVSAEACTAWTWPFSTKRRSSPCARWTT